FNTAAHRAAHALPERVGNLTALVEVPDTGAAVCGEESLVKADAVRTPSLHQPVEQVDRHLAEARCSLRLAQFVEVGRGAEPRPRLDNAARQDAEHRRVGSIAPSAFVKWTTSSDMSSQSRLPR